MKKHIISLWVCFLLCSLLFTGCGETNPRLTEENFPSTSGCAVASVLLRNTKASVLKTEPENLTGEVICLDNEEAYRALSSGELSLILTTEEPSAELNASLRGAGDSFVLEKIASDALIFYTPDSNPVKSLTVQELTRLFSGEVTDWRSFSGDHMTIIPRLLPSDSFYHGLLKDILLSGEEPDVISGSFSLASGEDPLTLSLGSGQTESGSTDLLEAGSISYGSYFLLSSCGKDLGIRMMAVSGVSPSQKTLSNGKYPFTYPIYAVIRNSEAADSPARLLQNFLLSKEGQKIIKEAGYGTVS